MSLLAQCSDQSIVTETIPTIHFSGTRSDLNDAHDEFYLDAAAGKITNFLAAFMVALSRR